MIKEKKLEPRKIEILLNAYLQRESTISNAEVAQRPHPDEDSITSFIECALSEIETATIVKHLNTCNICRQTTASLIELSFQIFEPVNNIAISQRSSVLQKLLASFTETVFNPRNSPILAYQQKKLDDVPVDEENLDL